MKYKILSVFIFLLCFIPINLNATTVIKSNLISVKENGNIYTVTGNAYIEGQPFNASDSYTVYLEIYDELGNLTGSIKTNNISDVNTTKYYNSNVDISYANFSGDIDISRIDLSPQFYNVSIKLVDQKGNSYVETLYSNTKNISMSRQYGNMKYTAGTKNNRCFLNVDEIATNPKTKLVNVFAKSNQFNFEGVGYVNGINANTKDSIKQVIEIKDSTGKVMRTTDLANVSNPIYMALFSHTLWNYQNGYFKGPGIDVKTFPKGTYSVNINITATGGTVASEQLYSATDGSFASFTYNGSTFSVYSENNRVFISVK